ncbi:MAG: L,D-transpeptidase family protein [Candidatus Omnitrophica bacterium]|nr:L,D-transpeptidase family protein [Candidatus Omnitrophota bacterium]
MRLRLIAIVSSVLAVAGITFLSGGRWLVDPTVRAEWHLKKALDWYRLAAKRHPGDKTILRRYEQVSPLVYSPVEARIELAKLYEQQAWSLQGNPALEGISLEEHQVLVEYLRRRLNRVFDLKERAVLSLLLAKISPEDGQLWFSLSKLYLGLGEVRKAISTLEKTLNCGLQEAEVYSYLGMSYRDIGLLDQAEKVIKQGLEKSEDNHLRQILVTIYYRQGKKELAQEEERKAKSLLAKIPSPEVVKPEKERIEKKLPAGLSPYTFLMVSKADQTLSVCRYDGAQVSVLQSYSCTTGKNKGQKEQVGDGRTPEGCFLLTRKIDGRSLPAKYGSGAYTLDFPSTIDTLAGRSGNGIWLHGTPIERPPYNSEGCIVLNDHDFDRVSQFIQPGLTLIYIAEKPVVENLAPLIEAIYSWKKDWESLNADKYLSWYDEKFTAGNKNKAAWVAYKRRVNQGKKYVKISLENLQVLPYGQTPFGEVAVAFFYQKYRSNNLESSVWKKLYLVKRGDCWKILSEVTL